MDYKKYFFCYYQPNPGGLRKDLAAVISLALFTTTLQPGLQNSELLLIKKNQTNAYEILCMLQKHRVGHRTGFANQSVPFPTFIPFTSELLQLL